MWRIHLIDLVELTQENFRCHFRYRMLGFWSYTVFKEKAAISRICISFATILIVIRGYFTCVSISIGGILSIMIYDLLISSFRLELSIFVAWEIILLVWWYQRLLRCRSYITDSVIIAVWLGYLSWQTSKYHRIISDCL